MEDERKSAELPPIFTIGHSTRPIETFLELLQAREVSQLVDIRAIPRSRHNPQFNREILPEWLRPVKIDYLHVRELGGLRHSVPDSPNGGWRNKSFRGFADYMQTPGFATGLEKLTQAAAHRKVAIMCAEAVPWRCHRSLIADALLVAGYKVMHIISAAPAQPHTLTEFAKVAGGRITYPPDQV
jgi:uncharacterized protein (DUF488 family)